MSGKARIFEDIDLPVLSADCKSWRFADGFEIPVAAGGDFDPTLGNLPVFHPLAPPTVTGTTITVDTMLQEPMRITQFIMDITLQRFILDRLFTSTGGVQGGAVVFDVIQGNDLFTTRDVQFVAPATEFPVVTTGRRAPSVAGVEKYGGKFWFSDEARDRNDAMAFRNQATRLGNTIVRKLNQRAVEVLEAAITANGGHSNFTGNNWTTAIPRGATPTAPPLTPGADFAKAQLLADQQELGVRFDAALMNPVQLNALRLFYQDSLTQMLEDNGFDEAYASNRVPVGTVYYVAGGELGELKVEQPLGTEAWREPERQRTWTQSSVRPVMFVSNPFAVMKAAVL